MKREFIRNKQNIIIILLLLILTLLVFPYILKLPAQITKAYWQFKESKLREHRRVEAIRIDNENQRRKSILQKYLITTLKEYYPCDTILGNCAFEITIPDIILKYYFGELKDKKLNKVTSCRRDRDNRYSKYCPTEIVGICPLDPSKIESINRAIKNLPTPTLTQQQTQFNLFTEDLHKKGYSGTTDDGLGFHDYISYSDIYYPNDKCKRLNLINDSTVIQDFQIELPTIRKMIQENPNESFIQEFANKSLKDYEILVNGLQDSMKSDLDGYLELIMQTIQNEITIDVTGDGSPEKIYIAIGKGCGSCHQKFIYIFSGKSKLFEITGDDSQVNALPSGNGFTIKEPIRKDDEPLCCPSEYQTKTYKWNGNNFVPQ